jgi:hypothetical protein
LEIKNDDSAEIFLNGKLVASVAASNADYTYVTLDDSTTDLLQPGDNVIAVHCHDLQSGASGHIDVGLIMLPIAMSVPQSTD